MDCFNEFGRCIVAPSDTIKESHGKNQCTIFLYKLPDGWLFGYDVLVGDIISSRRPLQDDVFLQTELDAKTAAKNAILAEIEVSSKAKRIFSGFWLTQYEQPELF